MSESFDVEELSGLSHEEQANVILDSILKVNNSYEPLQNYSIPYLKEHIVESYIKQLKSKPSTPPADIPATIVKIFSKFFSKPLTHILNACLKHGEWPNI